jgi:hypothetical protein
VLAGSGTVDCTFTMKAPSPRFVVAAPSMPLGSPNTVKAPLYDAGAMLPGIVTSKMCIKDVVEFAATVEGPSRNDWKGVSSTDPFGNPISVKLSLLISTVLPVLLVRAPKKLTIEPGVPITVLGEKLREIGSAWQIDTRPRTKANSVRVIIGRSNIASTVV